MILLVFADPSWADGKCVVVNPHGHMSYAAHNNFDRSALSLSYWYAGRANGDLPIQSFGNTHRWATACDMYGVAFCVSRTPVNPMTSLMYQGSHSTPNPKPLYR